MPWVLGHEGHDVVEANERNFFCHTCRALLAKKPPPAPLTVEAQIALHDGVAGDIAFRKSWGL